MKQKQPQHKIRLERKKKERRVSSKILEQTHNNIFKNYELRENMTRRENKKTQHKNKKNEDFLRF